MKTVVLRGLAIFFLLIVATSLMMDVFNTEFGNIDFFSHRGIFFLIFITLFPRLTLLFSSVISGGFIWWLGWIFYPRILIAMLATTAYFHTNPVLVVMSWLIALGGEFFEKWGLRRGQSKFVFRTFNTGARPDYSDQKANPVSHEGDVIEADFTKKS